MVCAIVHGSEWWIIAQTISPWGWFSWYLPRTWKGGCWGLYGLPLRTSWWQDWSHSILERLLWKVGFRLAIQVLFLDLYPLKLLADSSPTKSSGLTPTPCFGGFGFLLIGLVPFLLFRLFLLIQFLWPQKNQVSFLPGLQVYFSHLRSNFSVRKYPNLMLPMPTSMGAGPACPASSMSICLSMSWLPVGSIYSELLLSSPLTSPSAMALLSLYCVHHPLVSGYPP